MGMFMLRSIIAAAVAAGFWLTPALTGAANAQTAPAQTTQPAKTQAAKTQAEKTKTAKPLSPAQQAMRERQRKCGAEWKAAKAAGKIEKGTTWPKYWSACNKRLKAGG
jgi:hypothetical protein